MMKKQGSFYNREKTLQYTAIMDKKHRKATGNPDMDPSLWVMKMGSVYTAAVGHGGGQACRSECGPDTGNFPHLPLSYSVSLKGTQI